MTSPFHKLDIIIPLFNEASVLPELLKRLEQLAAGLRGETLTNIIFVNDGSSDQTVDIIASINPENYRFELIELSRNFGHQPAIAAGLHHSRGDIAVIMDADLQDPPELIPSMIEKWEQGAQVVLAQRKSRKERCFVG